MRPEDLIFPIEPGLTPSLVLERLSNGATSQDSDKIQLAITSAFQIGLRPEFVPKLLDILVLPNHISHEDIVSYLQQLKDRRAVDVLYRTALTSHPYLDNDEFFGLARKCTWALADIGTPEALTKLKLLASVENPSVASYAQKRIDSWQEELHRKGV
jgi:HEAT repeat protein